MSEKKNIVIKVKYPNPNSSFEKSGSIQNLITEWNVKRIGAVFGGIILLLGIFYFFTDAEDKQETNPVSNQEVVKIDKEIIVAPQTQHPDVKVEASKQLDTVEAVKGNVVMRAMLTNKIDKNEPGKIIKTPLKIGRNESVSVYYFAELRGMKGKTIYHEWLLNEQPVSRKKVNISADPWRTSSKQVITYTMNNDWKIRLTDDTGKIVNEKTFNLELK